MNEEYLDKITHDDCRNHISRLADNSIELFLSDIPYEISLDDWDVLHDNTNLSETHCGCIEKRPSSELGRLLRGAA